MQKFGDFGSQMTQFLLIFMDILVILGSETRETNNPLYERMVIVMMHNNEYNNIKELELKEKEVEERRISNMINVLDHLKTNNLISPENFDGYLKELAKHYGIKL